MANVSSSNSQGELVPKLRFPGFEGDWEDHIIGDYLTESKIPGSDGKLAKKLSVKLWAKGVVEKNTIFEGSENTQYYVRHTGQLMYGKLDFLNCAFGIVPPELDGYESTLDAPAFDINNINSTFLLNKITQKSFYKKNGDIANGSRKAKRIHPDTFLAMDISVPSIEEQNRISDFLVILENRIEKQGQLVEALKSYKRGLIRTLLSPERSKRNGIKWTSVKIGDLGEFRKGAPLSKADISSNGNPFILYGELYTTYGEVITSIVRKTEAKVDPIYFSKIGDVIIPTSGETPEEISTASCVMVPNVILAGDLHIFRTTKMDGRILSYILNHIANWQIARIAQGKSVVHIQASELTEIEITVPDQEEQKRIVSVIDGVNSVITNNDAVLKQLLLAKSALLQQLFI